MRTIQAYDGRVCFLSEEIYEILNDDHPSSNYQTGALVRLISGVDDSDTPGYHFNKKYLTVCRTDADQAHFCGIQKKFLRRVER